MEVTTVDNLIEQLKRREIVDYDLVIKLADVDVEIRRDRWNVYFTIRQGDKEVKLRASADSYYTDNDWIWFATYER